MRRFQAVMEAMVGVEDVKGRRCGVCQLILGQVLYSCGLLAVAVLVQVVYPVASGSLSIALTM